MRNLSNVDEDYFINCKTPESAYILGLLWGDGYLRKRTPNKKQNWAMCINCVKTDIDSLKYLFDLSGKWLRYEITRPNQQPSSLLHVYNKKLYEYLESQMYHTKSYTSPIILNNIPSELRNYWWRGYSDADGCIYYEKNYKFAQYTISSTIEQDWSACEALLKSLDIKHKIQLMKRVRGNQSSIRVTNVRGILKICKYIYSGKDFGLKRKKDKYESMLDHWSHLA